MGTKTRAKPKPKPITKQTLAQTENYNFKEMWVTCIGVTDNKSCGAFSNSLDERPHLCRPQSTVQTNATAYTGASRSNIIVHMQLVLKNAVFSHSP